MARHKMVNGVKVEFTAEEEIVRQAGPLRKLALNTPGKIR